MITRMASFPSVISTAVSMGTSRKVWRRPLAGQCTCRLATDRACPRPMVVARLLPPKLEPLPMTR